MPGSLKTEAIVLRSIRYGEADRILHLFTPERGRLSAIAKGVRRSKSRFGGRLEPFFRLRLVLYQGRSDLFTVTSAETLAGHPRLREDGAALDGAARACDAVARLFDDHDAHAGVYHLLANHLALLDADAARATRANALAFRLKLLLAAGFAPQLAACASCGEGDHLSGFSGAAGGVVCSACEATAFPLSQEAHDFLVGALGTPLAEAATRRRGRSPRPSGRSSRRSSTTRTCGSVRSERDKTAADPRFGGFGRHHGGRERPRRRTSLRGPHPRVGGGGARAGGPALLSGGARASRGGLRAAHPVPARSRPDRALEGVPPAQAQDAGLRRAGRRPLPHAAHPHAGDDADRRTVARALRLNEDLTEAIGLGHDLGHPPFGHIGEEVLDRAGRERFGRGFRHNEHSLRVVDVLERPQPHRAGPRRDPAPLHRRRGARDARGQDRPARRPDRLHQPRHRRRAARRRDRARRPAGRRDRDPRRHRLAPDRHAGPRPRRAL